jgi:ribosomal protein L1
MLDAGRARQDRPHPRFADGEGARTAQEAGADYVINEDEGYAKIRDGWTDFDVAMAVPEVMSKVGGSAKCWARVG